ncbi:MAG: thioredoxin family protein [Phycisphaerales bacterium]|nr:thioredoxin family protein [Phycisphaerales bacterium]
MFRQAMALAACSVLWCGAALGAPVSVFTDKPFAEAKAQAADENRLLVVKGTAVWCGPCRMMDRETWPNPELAAFIREHAVAVAVDVDRERELARELGIRAMPTIIVFREGEDFARVVGHQSPGQMLAFLEAAKRGKAIGEDKLLDLAQRARDEVRARMDLAREQTRRGKPDEAAENYAWLWDNMHGHTPSMVDMRTSFMPGEMKRLAEDHAPARHRFIQLRDREEEKLRAGEASIDNLGDWILLNKVVGDDRRSLDWFDRVKDDEHGRETIRRVSEPVDGLLRRNARWVDIGRMLEDPALRVQRKIQFNMLAFNELHVRRDAAALEGFFDEADIRQVGNNMLGEKVSTIYKSLLAADRVDDAVAVREALVLQVPEPWLREYIIVDALESGIVHPDMLEMTEGVDPGLVERLENAMRLPPA